MPGSTEICILGPAELAEPFGAAGLASFLADSTDALAKATELAGSEYKIVFYAEDFYPILHDFLLRRTRGLFPTFIPIPSPGKGERYAMQRLRELIRKAIGVDVYLEAE